MVVSMAEPCGTSKTTRIPQNFCFSLPLQIECAEVLVHILAMLAEQIGKTGGEITVQRIHSKGKKTVHLLVQ